MSKDAVLHVAVGVIRNQDGDILIALRDKSSHQGGLWEFPGGKVEAGETVEQALKRELHEELGIHIGLLSPLIKITHHYDDLSVLLDVWTVVEFAGQPKGMEGQAVKWIQAEQFNDYCFPLANYPIISAACLPEHYAILAGDDETLLLQHLQILLEKGLKLIQARVKALSEAAALAFFAQASEMCRQYQACLLVNSAVRGADKMSADGLHLTSGDLLALEKKPEGYQWLGASCHNLQELRQAEKLGVDFVVLAPVLPTPTHPDAQPLGWSLFSELVEQVNLPVYALGGMTLDEQSRVQQFGGQGIAGIRCFLA